MISVQLTMGCCLPEYNKHNAHHGNPTMHFSFNHGDSCSLLSLKPYYKFARVKDTQTEGDHSRCNQLSLVLSNIIMSMEDIATK